MSYAQKRELSGNRTMSIIFTAVVVGGLMYAIVTGLAYNVIKKQAENLKVIDVEEPPPPPEKPPPPPDMPDVPPPPMTPPPLVRLNTPPPPIAVVESPNIPPVAPPVMAAAEAGTTPRSAPDATTQPYRRYSRPDYG